MATEGVLGKKFSSYNELQQWIDTYQSENFVQLYVSDSRTIAAAQKRLPKRQLKAELQQLAYTTSEDEYNKVYNDFMAAAPTSVAQYFTRNWHSIRQQWVRGLMSQHVNLGNMTNNRLESINQKVKSVITPNCTFASCVTSLKTAIHSLRAERDHRAIAMVQKRAVCSYLRSDPCYEYAQLLTPFASKIVSKQMSKMQQIQEADIATDGDGTWSIRSTSGIFTATTATCQCSFTSMGLPCQHLLAARKSAGLLLFNETLCAVRWTRNYYQSSHRVFVGASSTTVLLPPQSVTQHSVQWSPRVKSVGKHSWYAAGDIIFRRLLKFYAVLYTTVILNTLDFTSNVRSSCTEKYVVSG